jgi:hypothetical protein
VSLRMKMSKICQRLNQKLLAVLAQVNEEAIQIQIDGFSHLSHTVQFDCFPSSLVVHCHFNEAQQLHDAQNSHAEAKLQKRLQRLLLKKGIVLKNPKVNLNLQGPA